MFFCKTIHQHLNMHFDSFTLLSTLFTCFPRFSFRCPCLSPRSLSVTTGDISHLWPQIRWLMEAASRQPGFTYTISNSNSSHMGKWRQLFFLLVIYQERRKRRAPNAVIFIIDCSTVKAAAAVTAQSIEMKGCTTATIIGFYTSWGDLHFSASTLCCCCGAGNKSGAKVNLTRSLRVQFLCTGSPQKQQVQYFNIINKTCLLCQPTPVIASIIPSSSCCFCCCCPSINRTDSIGSFPMTNFLAVLLLLF